MPLCRVVHACMRAGKRSRWARCWLSYDVKSKEMQLTDGEEVRGLMKNLYRCVLA